MAVMENMRPIDTLHQGRHRAVCCWQVGEVLIDPGPTASIENLLAELGDYVPSAILLTHIHLDHATASGTLARRWPQTRVYVHAAGARHMLDPTRLWDSATRLYGAENMDRLWGRFEPVPEDRLKVLHGGEKLRFGADEFEVAFTPGHAKHHVSYFYSREEIAFVGDVGGVRISPGLPTVPPTPPPDIDVAAWHESLKTISAWAPKRLGITHFGLVEDAAAQIAELGLRLDEWTANAQHQDRDAWVGSVEDGLRAVMDAETFAVFRQTVPFDQSYAGLRRYWDKQLSQ